MEQFQEDLELSLLHVRGLERRIADQEVRLARLKSIGARTEAAEDFLNTLRETHELLKQHLVRITDPDLANKITESDE